MEGTSAATAYNFPRAVHVAHDGTWRDLEEAEKKENDEGRAGEGDAKHVAICPLLGVEHPPTGVEFVLGCSVCRLTRGRNSKAAD